METAEPEVGRMGEDGGEGGGGGGKSVWWRIQMCPTVCARRSQHRQQDFMDQMCCGSLDGLLINKSISCVL